MTIPSFSPSPLSGKPCSNGSLITPLDGAHLHTYDDGYHLTENRDRGSKLRYDITDVGEVSRIRLQIPGLDRPIDLL